MPNVDFNNVEVKDLVSDTEQLMLAILMLRSQFDNDKFVEITDPMLETVHARLEEINSLITLQNHLKIAS